MPHSSMIRDYCNTTLVVRAIIHTNVERNNNFLKWCCDSWLIALDAIGPVSKHLCAQILVCTLLGHLGDGA